MYPCLCSARSAGKQRAPRRGTTAVGVRHPGGGTGAVSGPRAALGGTRRVCWSASVSQESRCDFEPVFCGTSFLSRSDQLCHKSQQLWRLTLLSVVPSACRGGDP